MRVPLLALLAVTSLVFAGCSKSEGASASTGLPASIASGEPIADAGSVEGIVVDDTNAPLAGALVALKELALQVQSDDAGMFSFQNLAPGSYEIAAVKLGYESVAKRVDVVAATPTSVTLILAPIPIVESYSETFGPFNGYFECRLGTLFLITWCTLDGGVNDALFPNEDDSLYFQMTGPNWETMVGEARWNQGSFATAPGMAVYNSYDQRDSSHWWCEADGRSPIAFRYERTLDSVCNSEGSFNETNEEPTVDMIQSLTADPGFAGTSAENPPARIIVQQRFELLMTIFHGEPAPPDFSGWPDA